ncbi:MAG TPA: asparagine synthase (glutamine-hydrolyzing), partial [Casimicrobiaceae bacterium]|nr:asparagine synthase (glutamine-hydrolyzing) [Casimicrobiaceae bacterium]
MCGILGQFSREGRLLDLEALCAATNSLAHRGPDDGAWWSEGPFFFGHRRLSIIDLSHGGQPMSSTDGRHVLTFNGEIYNYVELRAELMREGVAFATDSDSEVVLNGYRRWGPAVTRRLIGMFAFAIADRVENTLFLARDRFGEKPLFVAETLGSIFFASELKAFDALPGVDSDIDVTALGEYLCLNYVPGERTLSRGIKRLAPGTWRLYSMATLVTERYWSVPAASDVETGIHSIDDAIDRLRSLVDEAIVMALRSDVPVALFLSGGIDSSIVAESAMRQGKLKHAYCLDFAESSFSEWSNARAVASAINVELRRAVLSPKALEDFLSIVAHADDPLADSSAIAVWALAREVAKDYKVAISGDGGDELFGGYLTYQATGYHRNVVEHLPMVARRTLRYVGERLPVSTAKVSTTYKLHRFLRAAELPAAEAHFTWNGSWMPEDAAAFLNQGEAADDARNAIKALARRHGLSRSPSLMELQRTDVTEYLTNDILVKVDRMTMAHGLEARAPLLIPSLAEYALRLPERFKLRPFAPPKRILRELVTRLFGERIGGAKKQGFSIPVHSWLRGPARSLLEDLLSPSNLSQLTLLRADRVQQVKELHLSGRAQLG